MKRPRIVIEHYGRSMSVAELSQQTGLSYQVLKRRYHRGLRGEVLVEPLRTKAYIPRGVYI